MSRSSPSAGSNKKRRFLTAEKKFRICPKAHTKDEAVGEILRWEGLYSMDLARIRSQVKEGAFQRLSAKPAPSRASREENRQQKTEMKP